ncbi:hypothetical protein [Actinokineospora sp. NBRC 105648]|uniref:hypothetical protein n=1 Tax=Actinokineospora sp. NBRC 105648 TaxID=3032206 RepID=UPI0024A28D00|nr:hypothetical protein [Actinokineospora sp. NBRC 105648]GLZ41981.1 hypothetical protein Acsp05_56050 [Actinokineospora sp. NBRC 105648]
MDDRLTEVVRRFGRHALTDPVALRAALRETGNRFTAREVDALAAVAGSPELAALSTESDIASVVAHWTSVPAIEVQWALRAFLAPAKPLTRLLTDHEQTQTDESTRAVAIEQATEHVQDAPTSRVEPAAQLADTAPPLGNYAAAHRVTWEDVPTPTRTRVVWLPIVIVAVLALVGGGVFLLNRDTEQPPAPPPDRYATDQVAARYRALGARLLDDALRCAQLPARPSEVERVSCDIGTSTLTLTTYDAPSRLAETRRSEVPETGAVRSARAEQQGAGFAMAEIESGAATIRWDIDSPRPVSANLTTDRGGLTPILTTYDALQFGGLARPDLPGPAFTSGVLWAFAENQVINAEKPQCQQVPVAAGTTEMVKCPLTDGGMLTFALAATRADLIKQRTENAAGGGKVPGTVQVRAWNHSTGGDITGQFITFTTADDKSPTIYFDDDQTLAYGYLFGAPGSSPEALDDRWQHGR